MTVHLGPLIFWAAIYALIWALKRRPNSVISRAAFTWFGPKRDHGELRSAFELRRLGYAFGWLCQFALALSALIAVAFIIPGLSEQWLFMLGWFTLGMGIMLALVACIGFSVLFVGAKVFASKPPRPDAQTS